MIRGQRDDGVDLLGITVSYLPEDLSSNMVARLLAVRMESFNANTSH